MTRGPGRDSERRAAYAMALAVLTQGLPGDLHKRTLVIADLMDGFAAAELERVRDDTYVYESALSIFQRIEARIRVLRGGK